MGSDPADQLPSELEEGEFVAAGSDDDSRYVFQHRHGGGGGDHARPEIKRRRLEDIMADGGALPSPTPSSECDSDGTISDIDADDGAAASLAQELLFPCPVCRREFTSKKAVSGHMRSHVLQGRQQENKQRPAVAPAISCGWVVTGKRGSVGRRSVSPESQGVVDSMATVISEPVIDPMPIAFTSKSSSAEPNPPMDDSMAIPVASSDSPTSQVVVHPPCSPQFLQGHQPAAPPVVVGQAQPTVAQGQQLALAAAPQFALHQHAAPQVVARHVQRTSPPPPARDEQGWWVCKEKGCGQRYATHQGLGGHMAGHKNRQNNEALRLGGGDAACAKPAKLHPCKQCPRVFTSGVELGGHMRKHFNGKVTPKRSGARSAKVSARELASALTLSLPMPPAATEVAPAQPAAAPTSMPGVVRIFGVDIVATPPAAAAQEASSAVTETDQSSAASTNTEQ